MWPLERLFVICVCTGTAVHAPCDVPCDVPDDARDDARSELADGASDIDSDVSTTDAAEPAAAQTAWEFHTCSRGHRGGMVFSGWHP